MICLTTQACVTLRPHSRPAQLYVTPFYMPVQQGRLEYPLGLKYSQAYMFLCTRQRWKPASAGLPSD